jgi:hypothetical protein
MRDQTIRWEQKCKTKAGKTVFHVIHSYVFLGNNIYLNLWRMYYITNDLKYMYVK